MQEHIHPVAHIVPDPTLTPKEVSQKTELLLQWSNAWTTWMKITTEDYESIST
jgi:hypothetical protein